MRVGFLLGAGVSLPAGLPSTKQLTDEIVTMHDWVQDTGGHWRKDAVGAFESHAGSAMKIDTRKMLVEAVSTCCRYYAAHGGRSVNYEDLSYLITQLEEHLAQEYENPALEPLVMDLRLTIELDRPRLQEVAGNTLQLIEDVLVNELQPKGDTGTAFECLIHALSDNSVEACDIYTLNHDIVTESVLKDKDVPFVDGFGPQVGSVQWWSPSHFEAESKSFLLKLHGSVDWIQYSQKPLAKLRLGADADHALDAAGGDLGLPLMRLTGHPRVLSGTFNKIRDYFKEPYFTLWNVFTDRLAQCDRLFVSGYSFGDKGLNSKIGEWLGARPGNRLVLLHERPDDCIKAGRGHIIMTFEHYSASGKTTSLKKLLCDASWDQLKGAYL